MIFLITRLILGFINFKKINSVRSISFWDCVNPFVFTSLFFLVVMMETVGETMVLTLVLGG